MKVYFSNHKGQTKKVYKQKGRLMICFNMFIRSRLTYSCQNWNLSAHQYERIDVTYRNLLRRMVRGGFNRVSENDYRFKLNNKSLHSLCGTKDVSISVSIYLHLIRMPHNRTPKLLLFNEDKSRKRGKPSKSLLEQVLDNELLSLDQLCNLHALWNNSYSLYLLY